MKTTVAGHHVTVWTVLATGLALLGMGLSCLFIGCDSKSGGEVDSAEAKGRSLSEWIDELKRTYVEDGTCEFQAARERMIRNEPLLQDDPDFETAAMVLGLGETAITGKRAELAMELRTLAKQVETNPGRSYEAHARLIDKLFSHCFGNGPVDPESIPVQLADLYWVIATTRDTQLFVSLDQLYGRYVVADCTRYRGSLTPEEKAKAQVGTEVIISKDTFASRNIVIGAPKYRVRYYAPLPEGEVPEGERRGFGSFWGFETDRDGVTVLDVYPSRKRDHRVYSLEVIDEDTLWDKYDGWLFQLRREGAKGPLVPLKDRAPKGANN